MADERSFEVESLIRRNLFRRTLDAIPARYALALMGFGGTFNVYSLRISLSAVIVAMVNHTAVASGKLAGGNLTNDNVTSGNLSLVNVESCHNGMADDLANSSSRTPSGGGEGSFLWDEATQGTILAAYFYGYIFSQTPGAWLGRRYSAVLVWGLSLGLASIITLLIPAAVLHLGVPAIVTMRILVGLFSGVSYPVMHGMWGVWAPPDERSRLTSIYFAGAALGSFAMLPVSGLMSSYLGWQSVFYFTGSVSLAWSICWLLTMHDSPAKHPRITTKEREHIEGALEQGEVKVTSKHRAVPWAGIVCSAAVWSCAWAHFCCNIGRYLVLTMLPTYLVTIMHYDVKTSGILSSIPYVTKFVINLASGSLADWLIARDVRVIYVRKLCTGLCLLIPACAVAAVSYVNCNIGFTLACFTFIVSLDALSVPGFKASLVDMSPSYCGLLFSFGNFLGSCAGFIAPQVVGALREAHRGNPLQGWRVGFWLTSATYVSGALGFLVFGTSERQRWGEGPQ